MGTSHSDITWSGEKALTSKDYVCGYCSKAVSSALGYSGTASYPIPGTNGFTNETIYIYLCTKCKQPTFFHPDEQTPGPIIGECPEGISDDVKRVFEEARKDFANGCFTSCTMMCRRLLMNLAHDKIPGLKEGSNFTEYVDELVKGNFVPPDAQDVVDSIRKTGNDANHKLPHVEKEDAERMLRFTSYLLMFAYGIHSLLGTVNANP